jgi:hypothetical protein
MPPANQRAQRRFNFNRSCHRVDRHYPVHHRLQLRRQVVAANVLPRGEVGPVPE